VAFYNDEVEGSMIVLVEWRRFSLEETIFKKGKHKNYFAIQKGFL
jgi:hypothetical protein